MSFRHESSRPLREVPRITFDISRMPEKPDRFARVKQAGAFLGRAVVPVLAVVGMVGFVMHAKAEASQANFDKCSTWPTASFGDQVFVNASTPEDRARFAAELDDAIDAVSEYRDPTPTADPNPEDALCWTQVNGERQTSLDPSYFTTVSELHGIEGSEPGMDLVETAPGSGYFVPRDIPA